jgi:O-antigen/teichoic acid export membrane protein
MGIVANQSAKNSVVIAIAFAIGAINTLVFYPVFLSADQYGLVVFLLASSNLLMPLIGFGINQAIIKFYSSYSNPEEQRTFMSSVIWLPLLVALVVGTLGVVFYKSVSEALSIQNPIIGSYVWVIYVVAVATAYFEVFYAWARVQLQTVYGNVLKEIFPRLFLFVLLLSTYLFQLTFEVFVWVLVVGYFIRLLSMILVAHKYYPISVQLRFPKNKKSILQYAIYILMAGSAGSLILDIDKFMIPQQQAIAQTAFYAVAIFAATVVEVPSRALAQILNPLVAKAINLDNWNEVASLYKRSALNLFVVAGLFFLLVNLNMEHLYELLPNTTYQTGIRVVLLISFAKLFSMIFGCGTAIIANASFYRVSLLFSVLMAVSVVGFNYWLIPLYGIDGAAWATLIVVVVFTIFKIVYLYNKIKVIPFSINMLKAALLLALIFATGAHVDLEGSPLLLMVLKTVTVGFLYIGFVFLFRISDDLTRFGNIFRK